MKVSERDGKFWVEDGDKPVSGPHDTNAAAWRAADRLQQDQVSSSERRTDLVRRSVSEEALTKMSSPYKIDWDAVSPETAHRDDLMRQKVQQIMAEYRKQVSLAKESGAAVGRPRTVIRDGSYFIEFKVYPNGVLSPKEIGDWDEHI